MTTLRRCTLASLAGSLLLVTSFGGCGASSSSSSSATATGGQTAAGTSGQTSSGPRTGTTTRTRATAKKHHAVRPKLRATVYRPHPTSPQSGGTGTAAATAATASTSAQNPCTFVSRAEAQAILHAQISRQIEAPQGPTCLLEIQGAKQSITLAVEAVKLPRVIAQMKKKPAQLNIGGHSAYCGTLGSPLLFVDLGGGRALEVAAPCASAEALAAKALPRIKA